MAKPLSKVVAEAALLDPKARHDVFRRLPVDVDPELAARAVMEVFKQREWLFCQWSRALPGPVIERVLEHLAQDASATSLFIREAVRLTTDAPIEAAWAAALNTLLDFESTYAWGSKERKAKFARIAADPRLLAATQAAVVGSLGASQSMMAVLVVDGSEASVDALMPRFVQATETRDLTLDALDRLRTHASDTPAVRHMLAEVERLLGVRNERSPALEFGRSLLGDVDEFWFDASLGSVERDGYNAEAQCDVRVDSRWTSWFSVHLRGQGEYVSFDHEGLHEDGLGFGPCRLDEVPAWLARSGEILGIVWNFEGMFLRTGLRGKKRARVAEWLTGH